MRPFVFFLCFLGLKMTVLGQIETISTKDTTTYSEKEALDEEKFVQATTLRLAGKTKEAIPILQGLIKANKSEPAYYYELARTQFLDKDYDNALINAGKAVSQDKDNLFYAIFEAQIYEKQGNAEMAAVKYEAIVTKHPRVEEYYIKLARLYGDAGTPEKSIDVMDRMMAVLGESEEALFRKFQVQLESDRVEDALTTLQYLVRMAPGNTFYKERLAGAYARQGKKDEAAVLYREILAIDPTNARANMALAEDQPQGTTEGKKLSSIMAFIENDQVPIDQKISEVLGFVNKYIQDQDTSLAGPLGEIAAAFVRTHPGEAKAWALAGDIRLHIGDYQAALSSYDEALKLTKKVYAVYEQKMLILTYLKRYEELTAFANEALDLYPNQLNNYISLAYGQLKTGQAEEALSTLSTAGLMASDNHPQSALIATMSAIACSALNQRDNADKYFTKADQMSKGNITAMSQMAGMLAEFGVRLDMARTKIEAATVRDSNDPFSAATASLIDFKEKNYNSALKWMETSIRNDGLKYPSIAEQAGDIYFMIKNQAKAVEYWTLAKKMGVSSSVLDKKITSRAYYQ